MHYEANTLKAIVARYKKVILIGGISVLTIGSLLLVGAGVVIYKSAAFATAEVKAWNIDRKVVEAAPTAEPGFLEGVVLEVASGWLEQGLAGAELRPIKDGLSCFDALGGPSPAEIIIYVQSRTSDQVVHGQLSGLAERLKASSAPTSGPAACASWILNS